MLISLTGVTVTKAGLVSTYKIINKSAAIMKNIYSRFTSMAFSPIGHFSWWRRFTTTTEILEVFK